MRKFRDDNGGALTTVVAYNAFFAFFPLLLVVVTVLGFLLGRDSGFQQRLLGSAVAEFPIIGDQVRDNLQGLRGSGIGLVIGLVAFAWGARGRTQVAQHAIGRDLEHPGQAAARLLGPAGPWAVAAGGLRRWLGRGEPADLAWQLRRAGGRGGAGAGQSRGRGRGECRVVPAGVPGADPGQIPTRQLLAGALVAGVAWQVLQAVGGHLVGHYLRHTSQVYEVFVIVLGLLFWLYLGARLTLYAAEVNVVAVRRLWPRASNDDTWPSATLEPRPRGPSPGPAVSLTGARLGDHIGRMEKLSLEALAREQMKAATAAPAGRAARTVYGGHEHVLRQTLMALTAGSSMSEHQNPGEATVHVLHGRVRLVADAVAWEGRDGDLLIVPQAPHTLHALEDAAVLLTVAKLP
jgi:quercetin dioxygenase-like cupin family protein